MAKWPLYCLCTAILATAIQPCLGQRTDLPADNPAAESKVRTALKAAADGDPLQRDRALREALIIDSECPEAHWHLGKVRINDQWMSIEQAQRQMAANPHQAQFEKLREEHAGSLTGELKLARYCRKRKPDVSDFYYRRVLSAMNLPATTRAEAIRHLRLVEFQGQLVHRQDLADFKSQARRLAEANRRWQPRLRTWRRTLESRSQQKRDAATAQIQQIDDPDFVPVAASYVMSASASLAVPLTEKIAEFPDHTATRALTGGAVLSAHRSVRDLAVDRLRQRPIHDYVPALLNRLASPIDAHYRIYQGDDGEYVYVHSLYQEGPTENREFVAKRVLEETVPYFEPRRTPRTDWHLDRSKSGAPLRALEVEARERQELIEKYNRELEQRNQVVMSALEETTGEKGLESPSDWWEWWSGYNEVLQEKQTRRYGRAVYGQYRNYYRAVSCFAAGTPVATDVGMRAIESLKPGDRVLSQNVDTGELKFCVVQQTTVRPPSDLARIAVGEEQIICTLGHPFWVADYGWTMAKQLHIGDQLHSARGIRYVTDVQPAGEQQPAYNLVVAECANYFVGENLLLVHDNTYQNPTASILPGLSRSMSESR